MNPSGRNVATLSAPPLVGIFPGDKGGWKPYHFMCWLSWNLGASTSWNIRAST